MLITQSKRIRAAVLFFVYMTTTPWAYAERENRGRPHGPPPEAVEACANLAEGDACSFSGRRGEVEGTCIVPPQDEETLACAPEGGPPHDRGRRE